MKSRFQKTTAFLLTLSLVTGAFGNLPALAQTTTDTTETITTDNTTKTATTNYNKTHAMVLTGAGTKGTKETEKDKYDGFFRVTLQKDDSYKLELEMYKGSHPRYGHTITKLQDGRVLITGGTNGEYALQGANYFDPKTGNIEFVSDMRYSRVWHTATLLIDGNVLILGGRTWSGPAETLKEVERKTALIDKLVKLFYQLVSRWEPENEGGDPLNTGEVFLAKQNKFVTLYEYFRLKGVSGYSYFGSKLEPKMLNWRSGHTATYLPITNQVLIVGGALNDPATNPVPQDDRLGGAGAIEQNIDFDASLSTDYLGPDGTGTIKVSLVHKILPLNPFATATIRIRVIGDARLIRSADKDEFSSDYAIDLQEVTAEIKPQYKPNKYQVGIIGDYRRSEKLAVAIEVTAQYQGAEFSKVLYAKRTKSTESADSTTQTKSTMGANNQTLSDATDQPENKNQPVEKGFSLYRPNETKGGELLDLNTGKFIPLLENIPNSFGHSALALNDGKVLLAGGDFTAATIYDSTTYIFSPVAPLTIFNNDIALLPIKDATHRTTRVILFGGNYKSGSPTSAQVNLYCDYWYPSNPIATTGIHFNPKDTKPHNKTCVISSYRSTDPNNAKSKLRHDGLAPFDVFDVATQTITHIPAPTDAGAGADYVKSATQGENWMYKFFRQTSVAPFRYVVRWLDLRYAVESGATNGSVAVVKNNQFFLGSPRSSAVYDFDTNTIELLGDIPYMVPIIDVSLEGSLGSHRAPQGEWRIVRGRTPKIPPYAGVVAVADGKILITGGMLRSTLIPTFVSHSFAGLSFTQDQVNELKKIAESMDEIARNTALFAGFPFLGVAFHAAGFLGPTVIAHALLTIAGFNIEWEGLLNDDYPKDDWFTSVASKDAWLFEPNPAPAQTSESGEADNQISPLPPTSSTASTDGPTEFLRRDVKPINESISYKLNNHTYSLDLSFDKTYLSPVSGSVISGKIRLLEDGKPINYVPKGLSGVVKIGGATPSQTKLPPLPSRGSYPYSSQYINEAPSKQGLLLDENGTASFTYVYEGARTLGFVQFEVSEFHLWSPFYTKKAVEFEDVAGQKITIPDPNYVGKGNIYYDVQLSAGTIDEDGGYDGTFPLRSLKEGVKQMIKIDITSRNSQNGQINTNPYQRVEIWPHITNNKVYNNNAQRKWKQQGDPPEETLKISSGSFKVNDEGRIIQSRRYQQDVMPIDGSDTEIDLINGTGTAYFAYNGSKGLAPYLVVVVEPINYSLNTNLFYGTCYTPQPEHRCSAEELKARALSQPSYRYLQGINYPTKPQTADRYLYRYLYQNWLTDAEWESFSNKVYTVKTMPIQ